MFYRLLLLLAVSITVSFANIDFGKMETFKASFTQTVTNESGKKIIYDGEIFVKKSGKVLWKYEKPIKKDVYIIDQRVIIDEPELEQVVLTTLEKNIDIVTLLKNAKELKKNLYLTKLYNTEYFIITREDKIKKIYFKDELSNNIDIDFSNIKINTKIDDSIFMFIIPENYDVIEK